jgi:ATP-binding cassette subfamily C (CFTR/MRP) protein 1
LNRFSKDIDTTDITLLISLRLLIIELFRAFATLVIIAMGTPIVLISFIPLGILYYAIQKYYISTSRQLKRLDSASRSPIYSHFSETVTGASSIRAYNATQRFVSESNRKVDANHSCYYASLVSSRWLTVRLEFLGKNLYFN